nr:hypothetical protein [Tanacetum cinerariifolium]
MFTSTDGESIESYSHHFLKLMNDFKRNKHFPANYTQLYDFMKYNQKEVDDLRAERLTKTQDPLALMATSNNPYISLVLHQDQPSPSTYMQQPLPNNNIISQPSFNQNYMQQPMPNPEDITDLTTAMNMTLALMAKSFKLDYSTPTNNNQRISSNPRNRQIAQPGMNMGQDRHMQMNVRNHVVQNAVQNLGVQNVRNQNGLIVVPGVANQNPNGNVRPRKRDAAYLHTQLLIAQKEKERIQLQAEEFDLMATAEYLDEIEEVNANFILMANLQQALTSRTQTDKALVYDSDRSTKVHNYDNCYDNETFNMFTQEEQYTELLEPIPEPHQVPQNDNNVIFEVSSVEQSGRTVEQHPANVEETLGSENRHPMLNKENYVPWLSRLLRYAKSRPNGKLIHNSIINCPYVRQMIPEPGDPNREVPMNETFHVQTDDELTEKALKQIKADDQAIQTILFGLPEDIYAAVDSCETAQEIWLRVQQMMKGSDIGIQEKKAKLFNEWESNLKFLNNLQPEWSRHVTIVHQTKDLHTVDYTQLYDFLKYNQKENVGNQVIQNAVQNSRIQNVRNQNRLTVFLRNANQNPNENGNLVAARAEGNATGHNGNQIRCTTADEWVNFARDCTVKPRKRDAAYLQTHLLIAHKEEAGIQLQAEEYDLMAAAADLDKIEEVNANCILMANLQQASSSGTQTDSAPVYDSDGSAEVHEYENCYNNEIFNMFTQEEQYIKLLEPIPEP